MLSLPEKVLFILAVIASLYFTYRNFYKMYMVIQLGQGELKFDQAAARLQKGLRAFFTQGRMIRHRTTTSLFHYGVAWGFTFYILVNTIDVLEGYLPGRAYFWQIGFIGGLYRLIADLLTVAVLVGVVYFLRRRFIEHDPALTTRDNVKRHPLAAEGIRRDSLIVGSFILGHVGFRLLGASFLMAWHGPDGWQPFASLLAIPWSFLPTAVAQLGWHVSWWGALGLILLFMPYFPYSKHAHLFMGPLNFAVRPERKALGALEPINFDDESLEEFGVATLTDLSQKHVLDAFACIMCNRCQDACPAYATGKELSPAAYEINKRYHIRQHFDDMAVGKYQPIPLLDYAISESAVWACTSCGACIDVCPVGNEPMFDILNIRRHLVLTKSEFPAQLRGAFDGMERNANPWQMSDDRMGWAKALPFAVPTVEEKPDYDTLLWVGCAGAFDPASQEVTRAIATVMDAAGVNFAVLGNEESCTGDTARRAGNEYLFFEMAKANIEIFSNIGADKRRIVTACPHCLHSLGKEYGELGGNYTVLHHTQLITELVGQGKLRLNQNKLETVTYHDPCYLGRHNGVYDAPREALAQAGVALLEMGRNQSNSFCCGAGGAQMWKEEEHGTQAINLNRYAEARETGAQILAVGCPFCARMMNDANSKSTSPIMVKDVAQVVAERLEIGN